MNKTLFEAAQEQRTKAPEYVPFTERKTTGDYSYFYLQIGTRKYMLKYSLLLEPEIEEENPDSIKVLLITTTRYFMLTLHNFKPETYAKFLDYINTSKMDKITNFTGSNPPSEYITAEVLQTVAPVGLDEQD